MPGDQLSNNQDISLSLTKLLKSKKVYETINGEICEDGILTVKEEQLRATQSGDPFVVEIVEHRICPSCKEPVLSWENVRRCCMGHFGCVKCVVDICLCCEEPVCNHHLSQRKYRNKRYCVSCWQKTKWQRLLHLNIDAKKE